MNIFQSFFLYISTFYLKFYSIFELFCADRFNWKLSDRFQPSFSAHHCVSELIREIILLASFFQDSVIYFQLCIVFTKIIRILLISMKIIATIFIFQYFSNIYIYIYVCVCVCVCVRVCSRKQQTFDLACSIKLMTNFVYVILRSFQVS